MCENGSRSQSFFPQPFRNVGSVEKNSAYRRTIRVCSCVCVIQSRLKCNFCSISCGNFLNVSMHTHTHIECSSILKLVKPSWKYKFTKPFLFVCLFVRSVDVLCVFFPGSTRICVFLCLALLPTTQDLLDFSLGYPILKYRERGKGKSKSMLIVLSWIPCETENRLRLSIGSIRLFASVPPSHSHHEHVDIQFNIFQGYFAILWHRLLLLLLIMLLFEVCLLLLWPNRAPSHGCQIFRCAHVNVCVHPSVIQNLPIHFRVHVSRCYLSCVFGLVLLACLQFIRLHCERATKGSREKEWVYKAVVFPAKGSIFLYSPIFFRLRLNADKRGQTYI